MRKLFGCGSPESTWLYLHAEPEIKIAKRVFRIRTEMPTIPLEVPQLLSIFKQTGRGYHHNLPTSLDTLEFFIASQLLGHSQDFKPYRDIHAKLIDWIVNFLGSKSTFEFGCGCGYLLGELNKQCIVSFGSDKNEYQKVFYDSRYPEFADRYIIGQRISDPFPKADTFIAIECFEHMTDEQIRSLMHRVVKEVQPKYIIFSSCPTPSEIPDFDVLWGHINIKLTVDWSRLFYSYGFREVQGCIPPIVSWARLYVRS